MVIPSLTMSVLPLLVSAIGPQVIAIACEAIPALVGM